MNEDLIRRAIGFTIGATIGGVAGYFAGELIVDKIWPEEDVRIDGMAPIYAELDGKPVELEVHEAKPELNGKAAVLAKPGEIIDYRKFYTGPKAHFDPTGGKTLQEIASKYSTSLGNSAEQPEKKKIYIISEKVFAEGGHADRIDITYWAVDGAITNDQEVLIDNPEMILGPNIHTHFGEQSGDPDVVYVRNDNVEADYVVTRVQKSYKRDVLGEIPPEEKPASKKRGRRTMNDDDKKEDHEDGS